MALEHYSSDEEFIIQGHWWRPGGQHRPAGDLCYAGRKLELRLLGAFDDVEENLTLPDTEPAVIHGQSAKGTPITLLGSFYTNWALANAVATQQIATSTLTCNAMIHGIHLETEDSECFTRCSLTIPNLDRWLDDRPFDIQYNDMSNLNIRYTRPEERRFAIAEMGELLLRPAVTPPAVIAWNDATIRHRTYIAVEPKSPKKVEWCIRFVREIERLFTLLMGRVVQETRTQLHCDDDDQGIDPFVYLPKERTSQPEMNPHEFLVRFPDINNWFPAMLKSWFGESHEVRHARDLAFSTLEKPGPFLESRFLPIVQAVEVYSRALHSGKIVEKAVYKPIKQQLLRSIPDNTPPKLKEAIVRGLGYANEHTLRERFFVLLGGLESSTLRLFCLNSDEFVRGVVETRNHLTHYSGRSESILNGVQLHWATIKLQTMMKVLLLIRLGIPESEVCSLLDKNHELSRERREWKQFPELGTDSTASPDQ